MILRPFKKIKEQEEKIKMLEARIDRYERAEEKRIKKEKSNLHKCSFSCKGCKNFITDSFNYFCKLDCKCEDREDEQ